MKHGHRRAFAVAALAVVALGAIATGVSVAARERLRPARELAASGRALSLARDLERRLREGTRFADLERARARLEEGVLDEEALGRLPFEDVLVLAVRDRSPPGRKLPDEPAILWHRSGAPLLVAVARALRGEPHGDSPGTEELGRLALREAPAEGPVFTRCWSLGVRGGEARAAVVLGVRAGGRIVLVLAVASARV